MTGFSDAELKALLADEKASSQQIPRRRFPRFRQSLSRSRAIFGSSARTGYSAETAGIMKRSCGYLRAVKANVVAASPPYASQREYDPTSGFQPVAPEDYIEWCRDVTASIESALAADGSYFRNIKEHAEDDQRLLYVKNW